MNKIEVKSSRESILMSILANYRKTDAYKNLHEQMVFDRDNWASFLYSRVKKCKGNLPKEECLFWWAFLTDPEHEDLRCIKWWLKWVKKNGTFQLTNQAGLSLEVLEQFQKGRHQQVQPSTWLPEELQTEEAIGMFRRAEKKGIIERTKTGYCKKGITKAQLAYFLKRIYQSDSQVAAPFPDKGLSILFAESRLGKASTKLVLNNNGGKPKGYKIIDDLFND